MSSTGFPASENGINVVQGVGTYPASVDTNANVTATGLEAAADTNLRKWRSDDQTFTDIARTPYSRTKDTL